VNLERYRWLLRCFLLGVAIAIGGCGGDEPPVAAGGTTSTGANPTNTGTTSTTTTTTTAVSTGSIALALSSSFISSGLNSIATATVKDANGAGVPGAVVTFSTDSAFGVLTPALGTALTDGAGNATVILSSSGVSASGAASITARAQVGDQTFSVTRGYSVGAALVSLTVPAFGVNPLSTFGSTAVTVTVTSNSQPLGNQQVTFSSPCAVSGKASMSSAALTNSAGVAVASYQDKGCGAVDRITASASGLATASADLTVTPPAVGSIQYSSATPAFISLKGTGGAGRQESSVVKFKVVDSANNPLSGKTVNFALSTTTGGIALSGASAVSDSLGEVQVLVLAGTTPTPVRVSASTLAGGVTLVTQSDQLTISVGLPDQDSTSLSVSTFNIEGLNFDGVSTVFTIALADVFNNPVPDGTAVNFTTEGGRIGTLLSGAPVGSCTTVNSACTVTLFSQNPRPSDGRVTVLAYAVGEESFADVNGNGLADTGEFANLGEAFRDDNFSGIRDAGEIYIEFNGNAAYDNASADPLYNGSMCGTSCSARKSTHIFENTEIVFSGSDAVITLNNPGTDLGGCTPGLTQTVRSFSALITDLNGNPMPAGTQVAVTSENGTLTGDRSYLFPNTSDQPTVPQLNFNLANDSPKNAGGVCTGADPTLIGNLIIKVTTPRGVVTSRSVSITN
jgi:hypothetical protein